MVIKIQQPLQTYRQANGNCLWADNDNNLWLWGGSAFSVLPKPQYNAMWKYIPDATCIPQDTGVLSYAVSQSFVCPGDSMVVSFPGESGLDIEPNNSVIWLDNTKAVIKPDSATTYSFSGNRACGSFGFASFNLRVTSPQATINLHGDTLTGAGDITYQWLFHNAPLTGATSSIYVANASGTYSLQAVDSNGCNATASKIVTVTGISEELMNNSINVFPNPTNTGWQLAVSNDMLGSTVEIFDVTGRQVFKSAIENQQSFITCTNNASGVYQLRISWQGYSFVRKLVKM